MSITVQRVRLNIRLIVQQPIEEIKRLENATGNEMAEQRNVAVRDVVVANAAVAAVANVVFSQQIVLVNILFGAIDRSAFAHAPELRQLKAIVVVDHRFNRPM